MKAKNRFFKLIKFIMSLFANLNGSSFVGIKGYTNSKGETANFVVNANFSYHNAMVNDLAKLKLITDLDLVNLVSNKFPDNSAGLILLTNAITNLFDVYKTAITEMIKSLENRLNPDPNKPNKRSEGQTDAYINISPCIRLHIESGKLFIYALKVSKDILIAGEIQNVNSSDKTLAKRDIEKHFKLSTSNFRQFELNTNQLCGVNISGEKISLK